MKIYELLAKPEAWTKGVFARNANSLPVWSRDDTAVCWCLAGALQRCYSQGGIYAAEGKIQLVLGDGDSYVSWNDAPERTHADVLALARQLDI